MHATWFHASQLLTYLHTFYQCHTLTSAVGAGGEPWKPRLQRLADARQLAPFERLVLELLVGCHVSPSVQRTFLANKPGPGMDEMTAMSPVTVTNK